MSPNRLLKIGLVGSVVTALCCFTPMLAIFLGTLGFSAVLGWLDYVLLPALAVFLSITGYSLWKHSRAQ